MRRVATRLQRVWRLNRRAEGRSGLDHQDPEIDFAHCSTSSTRFHGTPIVRSMAGTGDTGGHYPLPALPKSNEKAPIYPVSASSGRVE